MKKTLTSKRSTIIFTLITLGAVVSLTFMFLIPVATDKNAYEELDNRFKSEPPRICIGVNWNPEDKATHPLGTSFHITKGEFNEYRNAIDTIKNTYAGQPSCYGNLPWYRLYL